MHSFPLSNIIPAAAGSSWPNSHEWHYLLRAVSSPQNMEYGEALAGVISPPSCPTIAIRPVAEGHFSFELVWARARQIVSGLNV